MSKFRFRIWHILLLTTVAAVGFAIYRANLPLPRNEFHYADIAQAKASSAEDGWKLVAIVGDKQGPYRGEGTYSASEKVQPNIPGATLTYTVNGVSKTYTETCRDSSRFAVFSNRKENQLVLVYCYEPEEAADDASAEEDDMQPEPEGE